MHKTRVNHLMSMGGLGKRGGENIHSLESLFNVIKCEGLQTGRSHARLSLLNVCTLGFLLGMLGYHTCNLGEKKHTSKRVLKWVQEKDVASPPPQPCQATRLKAKPLSSCRSGGGPVGHR